MGNSAEYHYGPVTDYSIKTTIDSNASTRGFTWGTNGATPIAGLNVGNGNMQIAGTFTSSNVSGTNTGDQTLSSLGYTGATNANYITNNNQLTNGAGYTNNTVANAALPKTGGTITGALTINSSLTVGNTTSSDIYMTDTDEGTRRIHCNSNRIGFLNSANGWGAYCDDAGNWGVAGVVSAAGGNSGQWNTAYTVANAALPKSGGAMTGNISFPAGQNIIRTTHSSGFLEGSYNNVGGNDAKSNPIYTIGSAYNPSDTALGNMYGIGYY